VHRSGSGFAPSRLMWFNGKLHGWHELHICAPIEQMTDALDETALTFSFQAQKRNGRRPTPWVISFRTSRFTRQDISAVESAGRFTANPSRSRQSSSASTDRRRLLFYYCQAASFQHVIVHPTRENNLSSEETSPRSGVQELQRPSHRWRMDYRVYWPCVIRTGSPACLQRNGEVNQPEPPRRIRPRRRLLGQKCSRVSGNPNRLHRRTSGATRRAGSSSRPSTLPNEEP